MQTIDVHGAPVRLDLDPTTTTVGAFLRPVPLTIPAETPLEQALTQLTEHNQSQAIVVNLDDDLVGLLDREQAESTLALDPPLDASVDELRELVGDGFHLEALMAVSDVMDPYVPIARPRWPAARALAMMRREGLEMLPVVIEGDSHVTGVVYRRDLAARVDPDGHERTSEPFGTLRDATQLRGGLADDRRAMIARAANLASSWLLARPVEPHDPAAVTFASVMLPMLSEIYDDLVEHYSDFQEGELYADAEIRPELAARAERLRIRQGDALACLSSLLGRIRNERRPSASCLRRTKELMRELRKIDEAEGELLFEAHYDDVPALD